MPRIQHKRGTSANLASVNLTPLAGELVWDSTENAIKIGDGATAWSSLSYVTATPRSHTHALSQLTDFSAPPGPLADRSFLSYDQSSAVWSPSINGGQINIGASPLGGWPSGSIGEALAGKVDTSDARLTDSRTPTAHASTHATGGSDALSPADIGAAPAASPAITGNATFSASSGVPVTITNTGTGNSFVVNDIGGDTSPFLVDASGNTGIGANPGSFSTSFNQLVVGDGGAFKGATIYSTTQGTLAFGDTAVTTAAGFQGFVAYIHTTDYMIFGTAGAERVRITSAGDVGIGRNAPASRLDVNGVITVAATSGSAGSYAPSLTFSGDANTGFGQVSGQSDTASVFTAGHERVRVDASGRVGIGTNSPAGQLELERAANANFSGTFSFEGAALQISDNSDSTTYPTASAQLQFKVGSSGIAEAYIAGVRSSANVSSLVFGTQSGASRSERVRIDSSGNVGIGTNSPASRLDVNGVITVSATSGSAGSYLPSLTFSGDSNTGFGQVSGQSDSASVFTAGHERVRVDSSGNVGIGHATPTDFDQLMNSPRLVVGNGTNSAGVTIYGGTASAGTVAFADGTTTTDQYRGAISYSHAADALRFYAGSAERVRVKATGAVRFVPLSADPASGEAGDVYYNSSTNKLRVYNGTSWIDLH